MYADAGVIFYNVDLVMMNDNVYIFCTIIDFVLVLFITERGVKIFNYDCEFYISLFGSVNFCLIYLEVLLLDSYIFRIVMFS